MQALSEIKITKLKISPQECLLQFKNQLKALQAEFPNISPALPGNTGDVLQSKGDGVALPVNRPPASFADQYFQHAVAKYLELIAIIEPIIAEPLRIREHILPLSPENPFVQRLLEICINVGTLGLPHLFHPVLNPETQTVHFEGDPRCYKLALVVRHHLSVVLKADLGFIFSLVKEATPFTKEALRYLSSVIEGRIERFEYNERYRTILNHYHNNVKPTLQEMIANLQEEVWESEELIELLESLTQITEQAYQRQAVIPVFLRDNPLCEHNNDVLKDYDRYPDLLVKFLSANKEFCHRAQALYAECPLVKNIKLGIETGDLLDTVIDAIERKQTEALKAPCLSVFESFKEKVLILRKRNDELKKNKEMLDEDVPQWSTTVCAELHSLIKQLKTYSEYNPEAIRLKITTSQVQLHDKSKFCRHLYHELLKFKRLIEMRPELSGHVLVYLMQDLLVQTTPLIAETRKILEDKGLTDNQDYRAIVAYLQATQEYPSLFHDLTAALQALVKEDSSTSPVLKN